MSIRKSVIASNEFYHVFNRSNGKIPIYISNADYVRAINLLNYYHYAKMPLSFSHYKRLKKDVREDYAQKFFISNNVSVNIYAFSIMSNHFHLLLQSSTDTGISIFMNNFQHSYAKYFNTRYKRNGSLFQAIFKARRIESDEQLLHVSRYIHLNPVTAYAIKIDKLADYPWTSFRQYSSKVLDNSFVDTNTILKYFESREAYCRFVYDQEDYQKKLAAINHVVEK